MMDDVAQALGLWGLEGSGCDFVRIKRPGYRSAAELRSELDWLSAMDRAGLQVPRPVLSRAGRLLESVRQGFADVITWLPGAPMGQSREPLVLADRAGTFRAIGREMARLHRACDGWAFPLDFQRCHWDVSGLLGEAPVWGRFWDNPTLSPDDRALFLRFRQMARDRLVGAFDYGLIHADLVRENVLLDGPTIRLIDFDDGGFGFRAFDLATTLLKSRAEPDYPALKAALIDGYHALRPLDLAQLDLFIAIRALTYVGWIIPRMVEDGGTDRNARFVAEARSLCAARLNETMAQ